MKRVSVLRTHFWQFILLSVLVMSGMFSLSPAETARAATITVNMTTDAIDVSPGDGNCDSDSGTAGFQCTLRAAVMEANALTGDDSIIVPIGSYTLTIDGYDSASAVGDLDITSNLTISGAGSSNTIIQAAFSISSPDRVFQINTSMNVTISGVSITGGKATSGGTPSTWGGGILNYGNLTLDQVYVHGNIAGARGGGLYFADGTSTMTNSTIYNNSVPSPGTSGGGVFVDGNSATVNLTINNSTISGNTTNDSGGGVAVYQLAGTATATLNHVTVANNTAGTGGGGIARISAGTLNTGNSIIRNNTAPAGADCRGTITTLGYNVTGTSCTFGGPGDSVVDPLLGPLADNGGPTLTHALSTISPAVDLIPSGTNGCGTTYTTDQRGITRPIDGDGDGSGQCDVGALESLQACPTSVAYDTNYVVGDVTFRVPTGTGNTGNIDCFLVSPYQKNHPNATTQLLTGKYWQIDVFNNSGVAASGYNLNLTIAVPFTPDANDKLCRYTGSGWDCGQPTDHSFTTSPDTITRSGVTQLSPWTGGNDAGPTALQLQDLTVRPTNSTTNLALALIALIGLAAGVYLIRSRR